MNFYSVFYWITVSDGVKDTFDAFSNIFTFLSVIAVICYAIAIGFTVNETLGVNEKASALRWRKFFGRTFWFSFIMCMITWFGYVATPSKKDCLLIVAGGAVGNFLTTDSSAKALPSDVVSFLHLSIQKEITELGADARKEFNMQTPKEQLVEKAKAMTKEELIKFLQTDTSIIKK